MQPSAGTAWTIGPDHLTLSVRLTPRSSRDSLDGCERRADGRIVLKARVRSVAEGGKANAALIRLLANALGVAVASVELKAGATGRIKILHIAGEGETLARRLAALAHPALQRKSRLRGRWPGDRVS